MDADRQYPEKLIDWLHEAGLAELAASLLEAAGPLAGLGAQALFMLEPLVSSGGSGFHKLALTLEDPDQVSRLVQRLRNHRGPT